ncbi:MAG: hypothetical protein OEV94_10830 [Deltaproteobacteria bacterium]|nr:hypothetical protein [Deltaproteobacteria bacterium]
MPKSILILEENSVVHGLIASSLDVEGVTLHHEFDPARFLEKVKEVRPDLILISNEEHQQGYPVCRHLGADKAFSAIPLILLANSRDFLEPQTLKDLRISGVIRKPFEAGDIQQQVSKHLDLNDFMESSFEFRRSGATGEDTPHPLSGVKVLDSDVLGLLQDDPEIPEEEAIPDVNFNQDLETEGWGAQAAAPAAQPTRPFAPQAPAPNAFQPQVETQQDFSVDSFQEEPYPTETFPSEDFQPEEITELGGQDILSAPQPGRGGMAPAFMEQPLRTTPQPPAVEPERVEVEIHAEEIDFQRMSASLQSGITLFEETPAPPSRSFTTPEPSRPAGKPASQFTSQPAPQPEPMVEASSFDSWNAGEEFDAPAQPVAQPAAKPVAQPAPQPEPGMEPLDSWSSEEDFAAPSLDADETGFETDLSSAEEEELPDAVRRMTEMNSPLSMTPEERATMVEGMAQEEGVTFDSSDAELSSMADDMRSVELGQPEPSAFEAALPTQNIPRRAPEPEFFTTPDTFNANPADTAKPVQTGPDTWESPYLESPLEYSIEEESLTADPFTPAAPAPRETPDFQFDDGMTYDTGESSVPPASSGLDAFEAETMEGLDSMTRSFEEKHSTETPMEFTPEIHHESPGWEFDGAAPEPVKEEPLALDGFSRSTSPASGGLEDLEGVPSFDEQEFSFDGGGSSAGGWDSSPQGGESDGFDDALSMLREEIYAHPEGERLDDLLTHEAVQEAAAKLEMPSFSSHSTYIRAMGVSVLPAQGDVAPQEDGLDQGMFETDWANPPTRFQPPAGDLDGPHAYLDEASMAKLNTVLDEVISTSVRRALEEEVPKMIQKARQDKGRHGA